MANPAALLHRQLSSWRQGGIINSYVGLQEQRIAARHIEAIEQLLRQMDDAGLKTVAFRRHFESWGALTFHHPHGWQKTPQAKHYDDTALENLEHLADRLDGLVLKLKDGGLDEIRAYAEETSEKLDDDESIDPLLRQHVKQVIAHLNWCIDNFDAVGEFDLQDAINRLVAAMMQAGATSDDKGAWKTWLDKLVWPFIPNAASTIVAALPAALVVQHVLGG